MDEFSNNYEEVRRRSVMVPPAVPKLSQFDAMSYLNYFGLNNFDLWLLGIRGYYKMTMGDPTKNDVGIYDDAIFIVSNDFFESFNANTDPSAMFKGVAVLKSNGVILPDNSVRVIIQQPHLYRKGKHGLSRPHPYDALRPATYGEKLPVTRDGKDSVGIAINIHKGSIHTTSSEGCQTIHPTQYDEFISAVYKQMSLKNQSKIPYVLLEK